MTKAKEAEAFKLARRPCKLGVALNVRREKVGKNDKRVAVDIPMRGVMLTKDELDGLVGKGYWNSVYETRSGGRPATPAWKKISGTRIGEKFKGEVVISFGGSSLTPINVSGATVKSVTLDFYEGGLTGLGFTLQAHDKHIESCLNKLAGKMDSEVDAEIELGEPEPETDDSQGDLPLEANAGGVSNHDKDDDTDADADETELSTTGRKIVASGQKAKRSAAKKKSGAKAH